MILRSRIAVLAIGFFTAALATGVPAFAKGSTPPAKPPTSKPPATKPPPPEKPKNLVEVLAATTEPACKKFADALKATGVASTLAGSGPFTLFVVTDAGFDKLTDDQKKDLADPKNKDKWKGIFTYHIVPKKLLLADLLKEKTLKTSNGASLTLKLSEDKATVTVDGVALDKTDVAASNGVIHFLSTVLIPKPPDAPTPPK